MFGSAVQEAIDASMEGKKGKSAEAAAQLTLNRWLGLDEQPGSYRQPTITR